MPSFSARDPAAVDRLVHGRRRRAKQLHLGGDFVRRPPTCIACAHKLPKGATQCHCGAYICKNCDEQTSPNGGDGEQCHECIVYGKPAAE